MPTWQTRYRRMTDDERDQWFEELPEWANDPCLENPPENIYVPRRNRDYRRRIAALRIALTNVSYAIPEISLGLPDSKARMLDDLLNLVAHALEDDLL